ncbi:hypothetical protein BCR36DRAFT_401872 [Piromyces finnis]|uniref:Uncharacterized protein n=2 Tax=Piromyces finnis TaxID=1754191 RepID=A0A1Y1VLM2_9FUNG|nr:hypothetical protein BCR36DRAFT_401872 [Piromyces finnis]|eukprot:ORX59332.1 hypothetical protein BCR36DRAFT_401872 [Piromyces finnis]
MAKDEKIYPSEEVEAPEAAYTTKTYRATDAMVSPYADQQSTGAYQTPTNPDRTGYKYSPSDDYEEEEPTTTTTTNNNNTNTYATTTQYTNANTYPVNNNTNNDDNIDPGFGASGCFRTNGDRDATSSLCSLCCGLTLCTTMFTCCLGCCRCCLCGCNDCNDMEGMD